METLKQFATCAFIAINFLVGTFVVSQIPNQDEPLAVVSDSSTAAENNKGREIYDKHCASCHGDVGQGVPGSYDQTLTGDMTLEALTKVIERTMPEQDPDLCVAADAQAVAEHIYKSFYSPAAQAKNNMNKIELTHRTNVQFKNSITDLLARFSGKFWGDENLTEQGMKASYFSSRGFDSSKSIGTRTDPVIEFDFGANNPFDGSAEMEEFAIKWFAGLSVDETGFYDFYLDSPNGVRMFVNDPKNPLINEWVKTAGKDSHTGTIYLLGGRTYLLKVEMFKYQDDAASISLKWKPPFGKKVNVPTERLVPIWAPQVNVISTALPPDDSSSGYARGTSVSRAWTDATADAAVEVANLIMNDTDRFAQVNEQTTYPEKKLRKFCERFTTFAFGRPLTESQKRIYVDSQFDEAESPAKAAKQSIVLTLQSPRFLYPEIATEKPDSYSVATRLALTLWDSAPDQELWSAAAGGYLADDWGSTRQAERMLKDPRAKAKIRNFFHHWLQMDEEDLTKDKELYPDFNLDVAADLRESLDRFLDDVVWSDASDFRRLYTSNEVFVNQQIAGYYGFEWDESESTEASPPNSGFRKILADPKERAGVLTHPYMMTGLAYNRTSSPIHRGVFVARNLIGRSLKQPPENFEPLKEDFDPTMTTRERIAHQTKNESCQVCHSFINPLGFSLERYDAVGRTRDKEKSKPIDSKTTYVTENDETIELTDARDLAEYLVKNPKVQQQFIEQLFKHLANNPPEAYGQDTLARLHTSFVQSEFNIQKLILNISKLVALKGTDGEDSLKLVSESTDRTTN